MDLPTILMATVLLSIVGAIGYAVYHSGNYDKHQPSKDK